MKFFNGVNVAPCTGWMALLTMTRAFNILDGESMLYSSAEIITLPHIVSFVGSSRVVTFIPIVSGPVARLNVCSVVGFFSCATLPT
jgi:hypothetical protein